MSIPIAAPTGGVAESILLPGDPLRAQFIAETFLEKPSITGIGLLRLPL